MKILLLTNESTAGGNGQPTTEGQGEPIKRGAQAIGTNTQGPGEGFQDNVLFDECELLVEANGSGATANIALLTMWGWFPDAIDANKWFPLGTLNAGAGIDDNITGNDIRYAERFRGFREATRLYVQYGALTAITRLDVTATMRG